MKRIILLSILVCMVCGIAFAKTNVPSSYWKLNEYVSVKNMNKTNLPVLLFLGSKKQDADTDYYNMICEANKKYKGEILIKYVNVDKDKKYAKEINIDKYPAFYIWKNGEPYFPKENKNLYKKNNDFVCCEGTVNIKEFYSLLKELGVNVILSDEDKEAINKVEFYERLKNDPNDYSLNFTDLKDYLGKGKPIIIDFGADWCGPCRKFHPVLEKAAEKFAGLAFIKYVDIDLNSQFAKKYNINAIPSQIFIDSKGEQFVPYTNYGLSVENGYTIHTGGFSERQFEAIINEMLENK